MGCLHDVMNANGLYTESDVRRIKEGYKSLWDAYVSLMCTVKTYSEALKHETDNCEKGIITHEQLYRIIHADCARLECAAKAADYVIKSHSREGLFH